MVIRIILHLLALFCLPSWVFAAISFVGSCSGTTSCTIPAGHQNNDVLLGFSFRDGNNNAPTIPVGWTTIDNTAGANSNGSALAFKVASGSSEVSGTWTSATTLIIVVYRGVELLTTIGGNAVDGAASTTVNYPTVTMSVTDGTSWVVGCAGHRSVDTNVQNAPTGMTNRTSDLDGTDEAACHDTNAGVSSWSGTTVSVGGTSSGWRGRTVELLAAATATDTPFDPFGMTGFFGT